MRNLILSLLLLGPTGSISYAQYAVPGDAPNLQQLGPQQQSLYNQETCALCPGQTLRAIKLADGTCPPCDSLSTPGSPIVYQSGFVPAEPNNVASETGEIKPDPIARRPSSVQQSFNR